MKRLIHTLLGALLIIILSGCGTIQPKDYTLFEQHKPRSILVLPPLNESVEPNATYSYLSTISQPLAEMGYYVFPVAVIELFLKENGLPTPGEMHQVPLEKFKEIFGADAVLYVTLKEYGSKYQIVGSSTIVSLEARLVDVNSGDEIWQRDIRQESTSNQSGGIAQILVGALVNQIINSKTDAAHGLSGLVNTSLVTDDGQGLLVGPYGSR